ncbi:MAG TPA: hypothetical protein VEU55_05380, partial [Gemmatimonadales bacterium]|nr:hypothetical protein [Gemmatimonadales bacterium]
AAAPVALERRVVPFEATPLRAAAPSSTAAAVAAPSATPAPAPAPATGREPSADTSGPQGALAPAQLRTRRDEVAAWPEIGFDVAGGLLGQPPLAIPGVPIRRLARPPTGEAVVVVEQAVDSLTVVRLYERRRPSEGTDTLLERERARAVAPPHPGRDVGPLRLEIQGPLPPDSLSRLLALVK